MAMYRVYSERLVPYGRGWAPWDPSPGVNAETDARNPPVQIGDVGYMLAGQFQRLFNVHLAHDDPAQADDLPDGFEALPLHRARDVQKAKVRPQVFCSQMVSAVGASAGASGTALFAGRLSFSSARTQGAVLAIPDTVHAEQIRNPGAYDRYVETHAERWHALAARRHLGLQMEDLMLVTGRDLTKSWGNAVFCDHSLDGRISLEVDFAPLGGAQVASHIRWTNVQNAMINWGPDPEDEEEEEEEAEAAPASDAVEGPSAGAPSSARRRVPLNTRDDQCIFIRHVCAKKRRMFHFPRKMKAAAEPRDPDRGEDFDGDGSVSGIASGPRAWESGHGKSHLLPVLDYILENSDVDIAIAHDGDLLPFLIVS
ncbi:hypothetical protein OF83DRAFT_306064 [Amylostereum chailletii]|nr:hypothetical protein OF83DRAFT_306064 [Amylostereum chailletii]